MKLFLLFLSILIIIAISYMIIPSSAYSQTGFFQTPEGSAAQGLRHGAPTNKTWLILVGTMAGFALMFLLVLEIGGGGLLPYKIEDLVAKVCIGIIAAALCLYAYYMTQNILFIILIPFAAGAVMFVYFKKTIKKAYMKKLGQPSAPNLWICRKCGAENSILINECYNCYSERIKHKEERVESGWTCENCLNINSIKDKSCARCGARKKD